MVHSSIHIVGETKHSYEHVVVEASAGGRTKATLDLSNHWDVADFLLHAHAVGYESASSVALSVGEEDLDNTVSLLTDYVSWNNKKGKQQVVRLDEIRPQMELKLVKIVEGVLGKEGSMIYHEFGAFVCPAWGVLLMRVLVTKLGMEEVRQCADHVAKESLWKLQREEQELNVRRKKMDAKKEEDMRG